MRVRCGACRSEFDVPGPGRHRCTVCGATNEVAEGAGQDTPAPPNSEAPPVAAAPRRVSCGECGFEFIVGDVTTAPCPMCGHAVQTANRPVEEM